MRAGSLRSEGRTSGYRGPALALFVLIAGSCSGSEFSSGSDDSGGSGGSSDSGGTAGQAGADEGGASGSTATGGAAGATGGSGGASAGGASGAGGTSGPGGQGGDAGEPTGGASGAGNSGSGGTSGEDGCGADSRKMILLQDPAEPTPSGWVCISCGAADPFFERFPVGAPDAGVQGGSTQHAHAFTLATSSPPQGAVVSVGGSGIGVADILHTHAGTTGTTSSAAHLPPYRNLKLIKPLAATEVLPAGAIVILDTADAQDGPLARYTEQDGYFIRGGGAPGTGGATTHGHTYSATFGLFTPDGSGVGEGNVACATTHTHGATGSIEAFSNEPSHALVVLARVTADDTPLPGGIIALFEARPSDAWTLLSEANGLLAGDFLRAGAAADFGPHGNNVHHPPEIATTSSAPNMGTTGLLAGGMVASHYQHTHQASLSFEAADQRPPFRSVLIAKLSPAGCP